MYASERDVFVNQSKLGNSPAFVSMFSPVCEYIYTGRDGNQQVRNLKSRGRHFFLFELFLISAPIGSALSRVCHSNCRNVVCVQIRPIKIHYASRAKVKRLTGGAYYIYRVHMYATEKSRGRGGEAGRGASFAAESERKISQCI